MRYIRATYRLLSIITTTLYYVLSAHLALPYKTDKIPYKQNRVKKWAQSCLRILKVKLEVTHHTPEEVHGLIMANHRSYVDILIILSLYPSSIVAKHTIGRWPIINIAVSIADIILVKRGKMSSSLQTMRAIKERIESNRNVILFPEGGIHEHYELSNFKNGSFLIAAQLNTPVTPIAIRYEQKKDAWYENISFLHHFYRQMGKKNTRVKVQVMPSILNNDARSCKTEVYKSIERALKNTINLGDK